jgi:hypothetical protein
MLSEEEAAAAALDTEASQTVGQQENMGYVESLLYRVPATWSDFKVVVTVYKYMVLALMDPAIIWSLGASSIVLGTTIGQSLTFGRILQEQYQYVYASDGTSPRRNTNPILIYISNLKLGSRQHRPHIPGYPSHLCTVLPHQRLGR